MGVEAFLERSLWTMVTSGLPYQFLKTHGIIQFSGLSRAAGHLIPDNEIVETMAWLWETGTMDAVSINTTCSYFGETVLYLAIFHRRQAVAEWLLAHGADPRISPELYISNDRCRPYVTSSTLGMAMFRNMTPEFIKALLKAGVDIHHQNEVTENNMLNFVVKHLKFQLSPQRRMEYMRILLDHGVRVQFSTMMYLIESYLFGNSLFAGEDLGNIIGDIMWRCYGPDRCATKIQRAWRTYRRVKACKKIQSIVRTIIFHPDHIWADGLPTFRHLTRNTYTQRIS